MNGAKNIGSGKSRYRLYVVFLPSYQNPRKDFNYFSDDEKGEERGKQLLLSRVLHGSCLGRYQSALLYDTTTNRCIGVYAPEKRKHKKKPAEQVKKPLLKLYLCCRRVYAEQIMQRGQRHPIIIKSSDYDEKRACYGKATALYHFHQKLITSPFRFEYLSGLVYDQAKNRKVGRYNHLGHLTFLNRKFEEEIRGNGDYEDWELGLF